jgi:Cellulase (glycosyl hydrolase family 5)
MNCRYLLIFLLLSFVIGCTTQHMELVRVAADNKGFVLTPSGQPFIPWGHNYAVNQPAAEEKYDWPRISRDFEDFRQMRANVARIHLQVPDFMNAPSKPNAHALAELSRLLKLAQQKGVYLDVTGLASYNIKHRAPWYDALADKDRWATQACFWEAVSKTCAKSSAVFCYDLMNEPVAGGQREGGWYAGRMGDYEFVQHLSLDQSNRPQSEIAKEWTDIMVSAIHKHDRVHLITIGMLPAWGPSPKVVGPQLDFIAVHIYPAAGKVSDSLENLKRFDIGKPIVVEETFPLGCGVADERDFLLRSRSIAAGWIGQYPEETPDHLLALQRSGEITLGQSAYLSWIQLFREVGPAMLTPVKPVAKQ